MTNKQGAKLQEEKETKMAETHTTHTGRSPQNATPPPAVVANPTNIPTNIPTDAGEWIKTTEVPYTVPALNLKTGTEEKVTFKGHAFSVQSEKRNPGVVLELLSKLGGTDAQVDALLAALKSASYQSAKAAAMSDQYLASDLKNRIVAIMRGTEQFGELSAKDCYDKWVAGFVAKKPGALKLLAQAQAQVEEYEM